MAVQRTSAEDDYAEQPALEWLQEVGWSYEFGPDLAPDGQAPERDTYRDVVLVDRLRGFLTKHNPGLPSEAIDQVIADVQATSSAVPIEDHAAFHRLMVEGVPVTWTDPDGNEQSERVMLIDFEEPENNDFTVVNQMTIIVDQKNRRPDILCFVNGIPLGQLELKSPVAEKATPQRAVHQVEHYLETIPPLYRFVGIVGVSDLLTAFLGTITTPAEHFAEWKSMNPAEDEGKSQLEVLIRGAFTPARFLNLLRNFVLFESDGAKTSKILAKYHQVDAVERAIEETHKAMTGDGRAGVVWHTQGAGKSYTMVFYSQMLRLDPRFRNPTIVAVTDRIDLDDQLLETFSRQTTLAPSIEQAASVEDLKEKLDRPAGGIIFSVINKFQPGETETGEMPVLSERENVIVMSDEAHRSQYATFAANLRSALPNAVRIGFTGTPIETADRSTRTTFGDYISVYDIARAVDDGATVPIFYENRAIPLDIGDEDQVAALEELLEAEEQAAADSVVRKETRLDRVAGAKQRVEALAADITQHFAERQTVIEGKGMAVAMNRRIAVELTEELKKAMGDDAVTCVITAAADEKDFNRYRRSKAEMKQVAKDFKNPDHPLQFVVVCDMWLTGFDVPPLHTMYIDKPMRDHGLLQAIARVNRVFRDKPGGVVVDYIGIGEDLRKALPGYAAGDIEEAMIPLDTVLVKLREKFDVVAEFFHGVDYSNRAGMSAAEQATLLAQAHAMIAADEEETKRFLAEHALFAKFFALAYTEPAAQEMAEDAGFFADVARSVRKYTSPDGEASDDVKQAVKQFFSEGLAAGEVVDIFGLAGEDRPEISVLSDEFLDSLDDRISQPDLQVALLRKLLRDEIKVRAGANQMQAKLFGEQLNDVLSRYANRQITSAQVVKELVKLAKDMREARRRHENLGLTTEEASFYDALAGGTEDLSADPEIAAIAKELVDSIRGDLSVDWTSRESREAAIRRKIKRLLRKHKYKAPAAPAGGGKGKQLSLDETTDLVLDQARSIYRYWPDIEAEGVLFD